MPGAKIKRISRPQRPEWFPYRCVAVPGNGFCHGVSELSKVHHVVHLPTARRVIEDKCIRAGLIHDESKLKRTRICVAWLSANTWAYGSIYGSIQFTFDWQDILKGRHLYWVEVMDYGNKAYRLLVTDRDLSGSRLVTPYNPSNDDGPIRFRNERWYWNSRFTSEFMVEADIALTDCKEVQFISHRADKCRLYGTGCPYRSNSQEDTGGPVLAFLLGNKLRGLNTALTKPRKNGNRRLSSDAQNGISGIYRALTEDNEFSGSIQNKYSRQSVILGALALYGAGQVNAAVNLTSVLASEEIFESALTEIIKSHFRLDSYRLPA